MEMVARAAVSVHVRVRPGLAASASVIRPLECPAGGGMTVRRTAGSAPGFPRPGRRRQTRTMTDWHSEVDAWRANAASMAVARHAGFAHYRDALVIELGDERTR